eukprot:g37505.t1
MDTLHPSENAFCKHKQVRLVCMLCKIEQEKKVKVPHAPAPAEDPDLGPSIEFLEQQASSLLVHISDDEEDHDDDDNDDDAPPSTTPLASESRTAALDIQQAAKVLDAIKQFNKKALAPPPKPSRAPRIPPQVQKQVNHFYSIFLSFAGNKAVLTPKELRKAIASSGLDITDSEFKDLLDDVDPRGDGHVNFDQFLSLAAPEVASQRKAVIHLTDPELDRLFQVFDALDTGHKGYLVPQELRRLLVKMTGRIMEDVEFDTFISTLKPPKSTRHKHKRSPSFLPAETPVDFDGLLDLLPSLGCPLGEAPPLSKLEKALGRVMDEFDGLDPGRKGYLNPRHLHAGLRARGWSKDEMAERLLPAELFGGPIPEQAEGEGQAEDQALQAARVDFQRYLALVAPALEKEMRAKQTLERRKAAFRPAQLDRLLNLLTTFESHDRDGTGCLSDNDLRRAVEMGVGHTLDDLEFSILMQETDVNGDGEIDFQEFLDMMAPELRDSYTAVYGPMEARHANVLLQKDAKIHRLEVELEAQSIDRPSSGDAPAPAKVITTTTTASITTAITTTTTTIHQAGSAVGAEQLQIQDAELQKINEESKAKDVELEKLKAENAKLKTQIQTKDTEVEKLTAHRQAKDAVVEKLKVDGQAKDAEVEKLKADKQVKEAEVEELKAEIKRLNVDSNASSAQGSASDSSSLMSAKTTSKGGAGKRAKNTGAEAKPEESTAAAAMPPKNVHKLDIGNFKIYEENLDWLQGKLQREAEAQAAQDAKDKERFEQKHKNKEVREEYNRMVQKLKQAEKGARRELEERQEQVKALLTTLIEKEKDLLRRETEFAQHSNSSSSSSSSSESQIGSNNAKEKESNKNSSSNNDANNNNDSKDSANTVSSSKVANISSSGGQVSSIGSCALCACPTCRQAHPGTQPFAAPAGTPSAPPMGGVPSPPPAPPMGGVPSPPPAPPMGGVPSPPPAPPMGGVPSPPPAPPIEGVPSPPPAPPMGGIPSPPGAPRAPPMAPGIPSPPGAPPAPPMAPGIQMAPGVPRPPGAPPPPPMAPGVPGPPGAPPPPAMSSFRAAVAFVAPALVNGGLPLFLKPVPAPKPGCTMTVLHWSKLEPSSLQGTVWEIINQKASQAGGWPPKGVDAAKLEQQYGVPKRGKKQKGAKEGGKGEENKVKDTGPKVVEVIDPKRAQQVNITLQALKLSVPEILKALEEMDVTVMTVERLENLVKILPTAEEAAQVEEAHKSLETGSKLGTCESFLHELSQLSMYRDRVDMFRFSLLFESELAVVTQKLETVLKAADACRHSAATEELLRLVLYLGNYLNAGGKKGGGYGFKLDTLPRLKGLKSVDKASNLLEFLIDILEKQKLDFVSEMLPVAPALRVEQEDVKSTMAQFAAQVKRVERLLRALESHGGGDGAFHEKLEAFHKEAQTKLRGAEQMLEKAGKNIAAAITYFAESPGELKWEEFFQNLQAFISEYEGSLQGIKERASQLEKKAKQEAAAAERAKNKDIADQLREELKLKGKKEVLGGAAKPVSSQKQKMRQLMQQVKPAPLEDQKQDLLAALQLNPLGNLKKKPQEEKQQVEKEEKKNELKLPSLKSPKALKSVSPMSGDGDKKTSSTARRVSMAFQKGLKPAGKGLKQVVGEKDDGQKNGVAGTPTARPALRKWEKRG